MTNLLQLQSINIGSDATFLSLLTGAQDGELQLSDSSELTMISGQNLKPKCYVPSRETLAEYMANVFREKQNLLRTFFVIHDLVAKWYVDFYGERPDFSESFTGQLVIEINPSTMISTDEDDPNLLVLYPAHVSVTLPVIECDAFTQRIISGIESLKDQSIVTLNLRNGDIRIG